jgi:hypothetical protein
MIAPAPVALGSSLARKRARAQLVGWGRYDRGSPGRTAAPPFRELLYGRSVDRAVKPRARIGLTILVFALGYSVIAARLVMFAIAGDGHVGRRAALADAVGTARPDILDRNGEILATDMRTPRCSASRSGSSMWTRPPSCSRRW